MSTNTFHPALQADNVDWKRVTEGLQRGKTYATIAGEQGVNCNTMIAWCKQRGLKKRELAKAHLESSVRAAVTEVGPTYGRRMMTGYLSVSRGIHAAHTSVLQALQTVDPIAMTQRKGKVSTSNPIPYLATHFGHKLHIDQNEKLMMFGVLHAACIDGYSGKIVGHVVLAEKNVMMIYDQLFVPILSTYGIWDQLRADHGKEWTLILFALNLLQGYRRNCDKLPFVQTFSTKNLRIERWWVEVNKRVNYPIKRMLVRLTEQEHLPCDTLEETRIVEEFVRRVVEVGVNRLVMTWNGHRIDGRGIPNDADVTLTGRIPRQEIVPVTDLVNSYERVGGRITRPHAREPISDGVLAGARDQHFFAQRMSFAEIYSKVMANDIESFHEEMLAYIAISKNYQPIAHMPEQGQ